VTAAGPLESEVTGQHDFGTIPAVKCVHMGRRKREGDWVFPVLQLAGLGVLMVIWAPGVRQRLQELIPVALVTAVLVLLFLLFRRLGQQGNSRLNATLQMQTYAATPAGKIPTLARTSISSSPSSHISRSSPTTSEIIEQLHAIDWFQFEKLIQALYRKHGYQVTERGGANPDGGIDLIIEKNGEQTAIQCKHWKAWKVNVKGIREFLGALTHAGIQKGLFVTLRGYTDDARILARQHNIEIIDQAALARLLEESDARYDPDLLTALDETRKHCPKCKALMVLRTNQKGYNAGNQFWGCSQYPRCRATLKATAE
jgi:HJR/Mrr/RecB family endonuclease